MLKVALLSTWHVHAQEYVEATNATGLAKVTTVWDQIPAIGEAFAEMLDAKFESDLNTVLADKDIDAVIICAPTNQHKDIIIAAANAGKHIFTEKVLAPNVAECLAIAEAVKKNEVKFCISLPKRTLPENLFAKKLVDEKYLGDITLVRIRNAHNGAIAGWLPQHFYNAEQTCGGAMIDLGAHPMYLARWILGKPKSIMSMFNSYTNKAVEDNAVSVIEFENKAIAISETGFVSTDSPFSMEICGTEGTLFVGGPDNAVKFTSKKCGEIPGWITPTKLPEALPMPIVQWINGILHDGEIVFGLDDAIALTELMEYAYKSHNEGCKVNFEN